MADASLRFNLFARDQTGAGVKSAESKFAGLGKKMAGGFIAAGAALGGVELFKGLVDDARESAKVGAITANVIKSTGGAAKVTADQVGDLATAISNKTGADDEAIQSGQNMLLTFTNVRNEAGKGNDIFNQASQTIVDMAAAMNNGQVTTDGLKTSSIQLGKALNDPIKGVGALSKVGVTFDAQQKKQIKSMVAAGNTMGAQKIILRELNKEFGGTAAAATNPAQKAAVAWGNLREQIGGYLLPIVDKVATFLSGKVIPVVSRFFTNVASGGGKFKSFRDAITSAWATVKKFVDNLLHGGGNFAKFRAMLVQAFGYVRTTVIPAIQRFASFMANQWWPQVKKNAQILMAALMPALKQLGNTVKTQIVPAIQRLAHTFMQAWPTIKRVGDILITVAAWILRNVLPAVIKLAGILVGVLSRAIAVVVPIIVKVINWIIDFGKKVIDAGQKAWDFAKKVGSAFQDAYNAVKQKIGDAVDFVKSFPGKVLSAIGDLGKTLYDTGVHLIEGLINGIIDKAKSLPGAIAGAVTDKIPGWIKNPLGIFSPSRVTMKIGGQIVEGLAVGIKGNAKQVASAIKDLAASILDKLKTQMQAVRDYSQSMKDLFADSKSLTGIDTTFGDSDLGVGGLLQGLKAKAAQAQQFAATIGKLEKMGLNQESINNLRDAGPEGGLKAAQQLLSGGSGAIKQVNDLTKQINATANKFADSETRRMYGYGVNPKVRFDAGKVHLVMDYDHVNGDDLVKFLQKVIRVRGGNVQTALGSGKK